MQILRLFYWLLNLENLKSPKRKREMLVVCTWNAYMRSCGALGSGSTVSTHLIFSRSTDPLSPFRFCLTDVTTVRGLRTDVEHRSESSYPFLSIKIIVGDFLLGEDEQPLLVVQRRGLLLLLRAFNEELLQDEIWHDSVLVNLWGIWKIRSLCDCSSGARTSWNRSHLKQFLLCYLAADLNTWYHIFPHFHLVLRATSTESCDHNTYNIIIINNINNECLKDASLLVIYFSCLLLLYVVIRVMTFPLESWS